MYKLYTDEEYAAKVQQANASRQFLYIYVHIQQIEAKEIEVAELVIAPYNYFICYSGNYTHCEVNPNYEQEKQILHRQVLDALTLTPADVERALYKAKGIDFEDLKQIIQTQIPTIDIKALSIEFRARDFYRGAKANGVRLFDTIGQLLGYSSDDIDYLFQTKQLPENIESES